MQKLTPYQLAFLYLCLFNLGESSLDRDDLYDASDAILAFNEEPTSNNYIPDEDGGPINASDPVYQAYDHHILWNFDYWGNFKGKGDLIGNFLEMENPAENLYPFLLTIKP